MASTNIISNNVFSNLESFTKHKRIACLYRVSTKGQVDKDDIPMQKTACREFISKQDQWLLVKEYYEKGVSGFKVSAKKRDELQRVIADAQAGLFDVLLVFMFDRLGRKEDETPFVLESFIRLGIEVWSVKEGQRKIDNHVDKLLNYISFWQSSGESQKTSMRVEEKHQQMVKQGHYRGGSAPYGYKLVKSGEINKKGKELLTIAIDEQESEVVKKIFELAYYEGYGGGRIANWLNENKIPTRTGIQWRESVVNYIFKNPIYKGYLVYGKSSRKSGSQINQSRDTWILSENRIDEIAIVDEHMWDKIRQRKDKNSKQRKPENDELWENILTKSPLLFVGMTYCGYCGSPLTTTYHYKSWTTKDGEEHKSVRPKYRCSGKAQKRKTCEGQTNYAQEKIEKAVLDELEIYLDNLSRVDFTDNINKFRQQHLDGDNMELKRLQKLNEENYSELAVLNKEVPKSLTGKSVYKPELLCKLIDEKEKEIDATNQKISTLLEKVSGVKNEVQDMVQLQRYIPVWKEEFKNASPDKKKVMLSYVIDRVIVYRDEVEIKVKLHIEEFINSIGGKVQGVQKTLNGERA